MPEPLSTADNSAQQVFVMGLPGAGKTTFLAALWHIVESNEVPGSLRLNRLNGDSTYLNEIRNRWIQARKLERTKTPDETNLSMILERLGGEVFQLWIPDLAGESFEAQWTDRVAGKSYCDYVRAGGAGVLFIHPHLRKEHLIAEVSDLVPQMSVDAGAVTVPDEAQNENSVEATETWDPRFAPTQVQLVDLIQYVLSLRRPHIVRLAIVISAWDRLEGNCDPTEWVRTELPLLHQFLTAHSSAIITRCFGISAQGGDFEEAGAVERLRAVAKPSARILVRDGEYTGNDIARPLVWLLQKSADRSAQM